MKLLRAIRFDASDTFVFDRAAEPDEWAVSGASLFADVAPDMLAGKLRQAFANGWLGVETFGRVTFVAVTRIEPAEYEMLVERLAQHFVDVYGAPDIATARPTAIEELAQMADLCADHAPNTVLTVIRELTDAGVREQFRFIAANEAGLDQFAIHATLDE